jgi:hypothetical protein
MNQLSYRITKDYLRETQAQAYRHSLARKFRPSFRQTVAKFFAKLALRPHSQPAEVISFNS